MSAIYREADLSAEETELQELQSQQQMALAVHHVLETMLPAAACAVEQAACELSRQLMELSSLAASQQELLKQALALSGGQGELEDSISEISCDAALISALAAAVGRAGIEPHLLPSGAGHDALAIATAGRAPAPARRDPTTWRIKPGESIQSALDRSIAGDTIEIHPGTYNETLLIDVDHITIRGVVENGQRAILDGKNILTDAVITSGHHFTIEGLMVKDYVSNGITVHGAENVTFRDLIVENSGLYGVYPVESKGVLVEDCKLTKIKDAAIYVGQSRDIIVRNNECYENVAGIEIENSVNSLVENNYLHDNTAGILVFLLPNNPSKVGSDNKVRNNRVLNNNHANFGDPNAIVGKLIPGTGMFIMAADRTEVTANEIRGNDSFGLAVVGLAIAFPKGRTFDVGAIPESNRIYGNTFADNGRNPAGLVKDVGVKNCDIFWDGSGWNNSFEQTGVKSFPAILPNSDWPNPLRRAFTRGFNFLRDKLL